MTNDHHTVGEELPVITVTQVRSAQARHSAVSPTRASNEHMEVAPRSVPAGPWLRIHETMLRALLVEHGWELSSSQRVFESWTHDDWPTRRLIVPTEVAAPDYGSVVRDSFAAFVMLEHGSQAARIGLSVANSIAGGTA